MKSTDGDISRDALSERVRILEKALSALSADNRQLASDNAELAERLRLLEEERAEEVERAVSEATDAMRASMQEEMDRITGENQRLVELLQAAQLRYYGTSSEQAAKDQLSLFNDVEAASDDDPETAPSAPRPKRRRRGGRRRIDLSRLKVVVIDEDVDEDGRSCPACGSEMEELKVEVTCKLRMEPAHLVVEEHRRHVYVCRTCSKKNAEDGKTPSVIVRAQAAPDAFPGSLATPSLVSWLIDQKYVGAEPLYRIEKRLDALGCDISRQDMSNWIITAWQRWLHLVRDRIRSYILEAPALHADETPVQVLREPERTAQSKSYCWVFCTPATLRPAYEYLYAPTRSGVVARDYLSGWSGTLMTDGYRPYFSLAGVTNVACLAHVRRRFEEVVKLAGGDGKAETLKGDARLALDGRRMIDRIFLAEDRIPKDASAEMRGELRQKEVASAMYGFEAWAKAQLPFATAGLKLEAALKYAICYMPYVENALSDGNAELTNNRAERAVKSFVIGRKNWMFSNTPAGCEASCGIYSITTTARENGLSPLRYVEWLLKELPKLEDPSDPEALDRFLPWSADVPDRLRISTGKRDELRDMQEEPICDIDPGALREDE